MPKLFFRIVALLLVPCLLTVSSSGAVNRQELGATRPAPILFEEQAFAPPADWVPLQRRALPIYRLAVRRVRTWRERQSPWFWAMGWSNRAHEINLLLAAHVFGIEEVSPFHWRIMQAYGPMTADHNEGLRDHLLAHLDEFSIRFLLLRVAKKAHILADPDILGRIVADCPPAEIEAFYAAANRILMIFGRPPLPVQLITLAAAKRRQMVEAILEFYAGFTLAEQEGLRVRDLPDHRTLLKRLGYSTLPDGMLLDDVGRALSKQLAKPFAQEFYKQRPFHHVDHLWNLVNILKELGNSDAGREPVLRRAVANKFLTQEEEKKLKLLKEFEIFDSLRESLLQEAVAQSFLSAGDRRMLSVILYDPNQVQPLLNALWPEQPGVDNLRPSNAVPQIRGIAGSG